MRQKDFSVTLQANELLTDIEKEKRSANKKAIHRRRQMRNKAALFLSIIATLFGLFWLGWILITIIQNSITGLSLSLFTQITPPAGEDSGGLLNAIVGSLLVTSLSTLIAAPIGILTGIFLVEYAFTSRFENRMAEVIRFTNDLMLSAPSIVIGVFIFALIVSRSGHFSAIAGASALALIQIPIIIRITENMLFLVPNTLREASMALGIPKWRMIFAITLKASYAGIATGILLALARAAGETAPLLFTALSNQFFTLSLNEPIATLPVVIYQFAMSPFDRWQTLAWTGVLLITATVLLLNVMVGFFTRSKVD